MMTRRRRKFSADEKERIIREIDACKGRGQISAILRREGITHAHLANWRKQLCELGVLVPAAQRPSPKSGYDKRDQLILKQQRAIEDLERQLSIVSALVELQKKATAILGQEQPGIADCG
jgi:transposase-like protein